MLLEIDVGNTRAKWRLVASQNECYYGKSDLQPEHLVKDIKQQLSEMRAAGSAVSKIRIASVRSDDFQQTLANCLQQAFSILPEFAVTTATTSGIANSYDQPLNMGVDRWSAVLAAVHTGDVNGACCVVDAGSALTMDFVHCRKHRGGYIVPGYRMQLDTLLKRADRVLAETDSADMSINPGCDTSAAVHGGILASMVGLVETSVLRFEDRCKAPVEVYITGGDALMIKSVCSLELVYQPHLVLDGLAYLLP